MIMNFNEKNQGSVLKWTEINVFYFIALTTI
jgi:hypothetical protein